MFLAIFFTLIAVALAVEIYERWKDSLKNYVKKEYGLPYIGLGLDYAGKSSEETLKNLIRFTKKHNGLGRGNAGNSKMIFVAIPEHIEAIVNDHRFFEKALDYNMFRAWLQDGVVTCNNRKKWSSRRKALTPAFHFTILDDFVQVFARQADVLVDILGRHVGGGCFNICQYMTLYTLDVVCETSMGVKINAQIDNKSEYVNSIKELLRIIQWRQSHFLARDNWFWVLTPQKRRHDRLIKVIHNFTISVIEERKKERHRNGVDCVSNDEFGIKRKKALLDILLDDGSQLSTTDIHEEVDTFMFAGHDTTTSAIEFLLYNLAKYPEVQEKVYDEVMTVFKDDSEVTLSKLNRLTYLDLVIKESLRVCPPVPMIARYLREDVEINGTVYPANHNVCLFIINLHQDEKYHKRPDEFIPERFLEQRSHESTNAYSYVPFSAGLRNCVGQKFAQYEIKTVISKILQNYVLKLQDGFKVRMSYDLVLRPTTGVWIELNKRN